MFGGAEGPEAGARAARENYGPLHGRWKAGPRENDRATDIANTEWRVASRWMRYEGCSNLVKHSRVLYQPRRLYPRRSEQRCQGGPMLPKIIEQRTDIGGRRGQNGERFSGPDQLDDQKSTVVLEHRRSKSP